MLSRTQLLTLSTSTVSTNARVQLTRQNELANRIGHPAQDEDDEDDVVSFK